MSDSPRTYFLEDLLSHEVRQWVPERIRRVLVPCGALEAHGSTGLATDTIIPVGLAERLAPRLDAFIAPAIPFGVLRTLRRYPGSVGLETDTYTRLMTEVGEGLLASGFQEIIFLNGHAGNRTPLKEAAYELHVKHGAFALVYDWYMEPFDGFAGVYDAPGGHSGAVETGMVLAVRPEAAPGELWRPEDAGVLNPAISAYPAPYPIMLMEEDRGLPDFDPEKAKRLLDIITNTAAEGLRRVLDRWESLGKTGPPPRDME
ncbi:MAG TPA: creatininase family protein [Bacteroidetes bacterium]|nr:creatininase family protein [Bacteroidota bacterium]